MRYLLLLLVFYINSCQSAWQVKPADFPRALNKQHNAELAELYKKHKGVVAIFWQSSCPCVKRYEQRVKNLHKKYKNNIEFIYISSNNNENFIHAQKEYNKRAMPLKLIRDEGGLLAHAVQARGTPTALLINSHGDVIYMGWIDNERREGEHGRQAFLEDALEDFLADRAIKTKTSPMFGCSIK